MNVACSGCSLGKFAHLWHPYFKKDVERFNEVQESVTRVVQKV